MAGTARFTRWQVGRRSAAAKRGTWGSRGHVPTGRFFGLTAFLLSRCRSAGGACASSPALRAVRGGLVAVSRIYLEITGLGRDRRLHPRQRVSSDRALGEQLIFAARPAAAVAERPRYSRPPENAGVGRAWWIEVIMIRKLAAGRPLPLLPRKKLPETGSVATATFATRGAGAEKHEREVQYFKRH